MGVTSTRVSPTFMLLSFFSTVCGAYVASTSVRVETVLSLVLVPTIVMIICPPDCSARILTGYAVLLRKRKSRLP